MRALEVLVARYDRFARHRCRGFFVLGGGIDDLEQEARIGLLEAIRDYRPRHGVTFRSFAVVCITRQVLSAIRSASSHKHDPLNASVSLDALDAPNHPPTAPLSVRLSRHDDPADAVVALDEASRLRTVISNRTSAFESRVLELRFEGLTYGEISALTGRRVKTVDNTIQRARRKLQPVLRSVKRPA